MSEETTTTTEVQAEEQQPTTPAVAENTETPPAEHMIPKRRFDEVNSQLKELKAAQEKADAERAERERQAAEEQGEFKKLYEKALADIAARDTEVENLRIAGIRQSVAAELSLPAQFVDRLQGSTLEEITADAQEIMKAIPRPAAPNINGSEGQGSPPRPGALTSERKQDIASRYGVRADLIPDN